MIDVEQLHIFQTIRNPAVRQSHKHNLAERAALAYSAIQESDYTCICFRAWPPACALLGFNYHIRYYDLVLIVIHATAQAVHDER